MDLDGLLRSLDTWPKYPGEGVDCETAQKLTLRVADALAAYAVVHQSTPAMGLTESHRREMVDGLWIIAKKLEPMMTFPHALRASAIAVFLADALRSDRAVEPVVDPRRRLDALRPVHDALMKIATLAAAPPIGSTEMTQARKTAALLLATLPLPAHEPAEPAETTPAPSHR